MPANNPSAYSNPDGSFGNSKDAIANIGTESFGGDRQPVDIQGLLNLVLGSQAPEPVRQGRQVVEQAKPPVQQSVTPPVRPANSAAPLQSPPAVQETTNANPAIGPSIPDIIKLALAEQANVGDTGELNINAVSRIGELSEQPAPRELDASIPDSTGTYRRTAPGQGTINNLNEMSHFIDFISGILPGIGATKSVGDLATASKALKGKPKNISINTRGKINPLELETEVTKRLNPAIESGKPLTNPSKSLSNEEKDFMAGEFKEVGNTSDEIKAAILKHFRSSDSSKKLRDFPSIQDTLDKALGL